MSILPTLFLSHGAPPLADDPIWPGELARWSAAFPRPESILIVSAHWEQAPVTVSATAPGVPLVYDFWGFPEKYYEVSYAAPAAPDLARSVARLVGGPVRADEARGLDHGAYVPLAEMYPHADVPVLQLSLPTLDPGVLYALGERLMPLRDEGVLIVGSGFTTHNLRWFDPARPGVTPVASAEFDQWARGAVGTGDVDALLGWERSAPAARVAHPRSEHWVPLYVALGAAGGVPGRTAVEGFWYGLSKRSWQFG